MQSFFNLTPHTSIYLDSVFLKKIDDSHYNIISVTLIFSIIFYLDQ